MDKATEKYGNLAKSDKSVAEKYYLILSIEKKGGANNGA